MQNQTKLSKIKENVKNFLYLDLNVDKDFEFICHHPIFGQTVFFDPKTKELLDLTNDVHLIRARTIMKNMIDEISDLHHITMMIQKPYLPAFFKFNEQYLSEKDYAELLGDIWVSVEFPNYDANISVNEFKEYFKNANKEFLMGSDFDDFFNLPNEMTVYRGTCLKSTTKALSWTLDFNKAKWFAERFGSNGKVYEAKIDKDNIYAYFKCRNEEEIVLDYTKLKDLKKVFDAEKNLDVLEFEER